jgi:Brp/Blh family beta-carotene 15,15'-monooxygenase
MVLQFLAVLSIGALISGLFLVRRSWLCAAELATLPLLAWALPPISFFVVYFCGLHSPRHFLEVIGWLQMRANVVSAVALGITLATLSSCAAAFMMLPSVSPDVRLVQIVFIGLAALTVPHMILLRKVGWREAQFGRAWL